MSYEILNVKGSKICTLHTKTEPSMRKAGNLYYGRVIKRSVTNVMIGFNYENSVNNRMEKEGIPGKFFAHERKWGQRIKGTPFIEYKGQLYLEAMVLKCVSNTYYVDNKVATPSQVEYIKSMLTSSSNSRQPVENKIILRDYALPSIEAVKMDGKLHSFIGREVYEEALTENSISS